MTWTSLEAISPIDGRYEGKTADFKPFFSEKALIQYRIRIEIEYFIALSESEVSQVPAFTEEDCTFLRAIYTDMTIEDAQRVKDIEKVTNHDVKAVEYFIKEKLQGHKLEANKEFIHFGLTSQDINNTATPLLLKEAFETVYLPKLDEVITTLEKYAEEWKTISMLAKTHGQPASPTRLGKEINVFVARLKAQRAQLVAVPFSAKFGGATGNFNAHHIAFPEIDWLAFGNKFVENTLGLTHSFPTTQIEHYDNLAAFFDACKRVNTILIDLDRDFWTYISMEYFKQKIKKGEIGSSAMPHKVNPIDFENSEGNLGLANALFEHLSGKLPISRLQRDLTDSTVLRNIGVPMAHTTLAFQALLKGLNKLLLNEAAINADLEKNWAVVAEAVQTILRREAYPNPYEALKELTRTNEAITQNSIAQFIDTLDVSDALKSQLKTITPQNFTGI